MYPAPFEYARAGSWAEAVDLLARHGEDAKVIAGGQSLVPMMALRLIKPAVLVDVNDADGPRSEGVRLVDGHLEVSALTRHAKLERSPLVAEGCPLLGEAAAQIGNVRVRHRGTIGGSLAHGDPSAELPCVTMAMGAEIHTLGPGGQRRHRADSFFLTYLTTALEPDEVVVSVSFPVLAAWQGSSFVELARRAGDFATVAVAAVVETEPGGGVCRDVRLVAAAVSDRPVDLSGAARQELAGARLDGPHLDQAARAAAAAAEPRDDDNASAAYRTQVLQVLARRALVRAAARAGSSDVDAGGA